MVKRVQHVRHSTAAADLYIGLIGEITVDIDGKTLRLHDGVTAGGKVIDKVILNPALSSINALTPAADRVPYYTSDSAAALAVLTAAGRALLDDNDAAAQLTTLGVSAFIKTLLDDSSAAIARTTLDIQIKSGTFTRNLETASGNVGYTGVGFQPTILLIAGAKTAAAGQVSIGWTFGTTEFCIDSRYGQTAGSWGANNGLIIEILLDGSNFQLAAVDSLDSDGFTLAWTRGGTGQSGTVTFGYLAIRL
jgi:hypothetical protein